MVQAQCGLPGFTLNSSAGFTIETVDYDDKDLGSGGRLLLSQNDVTTSIASPPTMVEGPTQTTASTTVSYPPTATAVIASTGIAIGLPDNFTYPNLTYGGSPSSTPGWNPDMNTTIDYNVTIPGSTGKGTIAYNVTISGSTGQGGTAAVGIAYPIAYSPTGLVGTFVNESRDFSTSY